MTEVRRPVTAEGKEAERVAREMRPVRLKPSEPPPDEEAEGVCIPPEVVDDIIHAGKRLSKKVRWAIAQAYRVECAMSGGLFTFEPTDLAAIALVLKEAINNYESVIEDTHIADVKEVQ